ncbi:hypothetical protein PS15m_007882 [Mucor circinelloides]
MFKPTIESIDHIVVAVSDIEKSAEWYHTMLGMKIQRFKTPSAPNQDRIALGFGQQKVNLHQRDIEVFPVCKKPALEGTADFCLISKQPVEDFLRHWKEHSCELAVETPVKRTGAQGQLLSVYVYDLDGNLVEVSNYVE